MTRKHGHTLAAVDSDHNLIADTADGFHGDDGQPVAGATGCYQRRLSVQQSRVQRRQDRSACPVPGTVIFQDIGWWHYGFVTARDFYVVGGLNLRAFVADLIDESVSCRDCAGCAPRDVWTDPPHADCYVECAQALFAAMGPNPCGPTALSEELLLFAVVALYHDAGFPGVDEVMWDGAGAHVCRAVGYFHELGRHQAARQLRAGVIGRSRQGRPPAAVCLLARPRMVDPARLAAYDQARAALVARRLCAAELLDPHGDFDGEFVAELA